MRVDKTYKPYKRQSAEEMTMIDRIAQLLKKRWYFQGFNGTPALLHGASRSMVYDMPTMLGYGYGSCIEFFEEDKCYYLYAWDDLYAILKELRAHVTSEPHYLKSLLEQDAKVCKKVLQTYKKIEKIDWTKIPTEKLCELLRTVNEMYSYLLSISHIVEGFTLTTEETIRGLVKKQFPNNSDEMIKALTAPLSHSFMSIEHNELYLIVAEIEKLKIKNVDADTLTKYPHIRRLVENHQKKYFWKLNGYTSAKILGVDNFVQEIREIITKGIGVEEKIKAFNDIKNNKSRKQKILKEINHPELKELIAINDVIFRIHDRRKEHMTIAIHYLDGLLREIGKRCDVPLELMRYITPEELGQASQLKDILAERRKKSVYIRFPDTQYILVGKEAEQCIAALKVQLQTEHADSIKGNCASRGKAVGIVKVCRGEKELGKVMQGDILVACMTQPEFVPAMKKAAAVITDEGGLTCHAAIITRELHIPCVIGTKVGTQVLKDGMRVEVDADKGIVRILHN